MKIVILAIILQVSNFCSAQSVKELIKLIEPKEPFRAVLSYRDEPRLYFKYDSLKSPNIKYYCKDENDSIANGWYLVHELRGRIRTAYIGVSAYFSGVGLLGRTYSAYLKDGIPSGTWEYIYDDLPSSFSDIIRKQESYNKGLLDGEFIFYSSTDTLYRTTFVNGTGHYRDYFNDGRLMFEGDLIHGYRNGIWSYYQYDNDSTNTPYKVHVECYKSSELEHRELFYPDSRVYNIIEWERSVANRKKHPRKKNEVMINPYIYNRP